jgi:hypothetical protein
VVRTRSGNRDDITRAFGDRVRFDPEQLPSRDGSRGTVMKLGRDLRCHNCRDVVRAESLVHGSDQQACHPSA